MSREAQRNSLTALTALAVIDVQLAIDDPRWGPRNNPAAEAVIAELLGAWRAHNQPIFHVRHDSTDPSSPYRPDLATNAFKPQAMPLAGETIVAKQTNSAFIGTDFADLIRSCGADGIVYAGVLTNNSLEATVRTSGNLGFRSYVVADACWSVDTTDLNGKVWPAADVHALALANMHNEYATVVTSAQAADLLNP